MSIRAFVQVFKTWGKASDGLDGLLYGKTFHRSLTTEGFVALVGFDDVTAALQDLPAIDKAGG